MITYTIEKRRASVRKALKKLYDSRRAKGVCLHCPDRPARPGCTRCTECIEHARMVRKIRRGCAA